MPVFISYSHRDKDFVDKLAVHLTLSKVHVWVDRWELHVGDSLITKIQQVMQDASALLVVLSPASVESEWCKKELSVGLIRELEERRVVVLPLLLEDCKVPLFLTDKLYADFRTNYDEGLRQVLEAVATVTSDTLGRVEEPEWHTDWVVDWGETDGNFWLRLTLIIQGDARPYSTLAEVQMLCNDIATARYQQYAETGLEPLGRLILFESLRGMKELADLQLCLPDNLPQTRKAVAYDPKTKAQMDVTITCRRLGEDTGRDILLHLGQQVCGTINQMLRRGRPITPEEQEKIKKIMRLAQGCLNPETLSVLSFHFLSDKKSFIAAGAVGLWASAACPSACGQPKGLSIRRGKSSSPEKCIVRSNTERNSGPASWGYAPRCGVSFFLCLGEKPELSMRFRPYPILKARCSRCGRLMRWKSSGRQLLDPRRLLGNDLITCLKLALDSFRALLIHGDSY